MIQTEVDRRHQDQKWAAEHSGELAEHAGQYLVPCESRIVAHGTDLESVLNEASLVTGKRRDELVFCVIDDLLTELPR